MTRKLTLKIDEALITQAKHYARSRGRSLSKLVEGYFHFLSEREAAEADPISPIVRELSGVIRLPEGYDRKSDHGRHLARKYR